MEGKSQLGFTRRGCQLLGSWGKPDCLGDQELKQERGVIRFEPFPLQSFPGFHSLGVNCGGGVQERGKTRKRGSSELLATQTGKTLLRKHSSASDREDVEPPGAVWLDDHCYLWVGDEVEQVGGDDEGGEGVLRVGPVPPLLLLLNVAREEQGGHTAGYQVMHQIL